jgi:protein-S-isoprenylcysteine O-methyltransferase Ste14
MTRWLVPGGFVIAAAVTGEHAWQGILTATGSPTARHILLAQYALLRAAVAIAFALFTIQRSQPHRHSRDPLAFVVCGFAMAAVMAVAGPGQGTPPGLLLAGDFVAVCGCVWLLASVLTLGRCFGVLPEARGLVVRGPYGLVRHPVYVGEIVALSGLTLAAPGPWNLVLLAIFVAAQILRTRMEERALSDAFPDYASYAARTGRLLPKMAPARRVAR